MHAFPYSTTYTTFNEPNGLICMLLNLSAWSSMSLIELNRLELVNAFLSYKRGSNRRRFVMPAGLASLNLGQQKQTRCSRFGRAFPHIVLFGPGSLLIA